jgi:hypothetical protein
MKEPAPVHRPSNAIPRGSIPYVILGLLLLLAADYVVVGLIFKRGLIPGYVLTATPTQTGTPTAEASLREAGLNGSAVSVPSATLVPLAQTPQTETPVTLTPGMNEIPVVTDTPEFPPTPAPTPTFTVSPTPVYTACQYALKPGPQDFLYAIYWSWHIDQKIPVLQNFYAGITCAVIASNEKCAYHAAEPGVTQPGWILILPGVTPNICLYHGGTPVP